MILYVAECMCAAHIPLASHPREAYTPKKGRPPPEAVIGGRIGIQIKRRVLFPTTRLPQLLSPRAFSATHPPPLHSRAVGEKE